MDQPSPPPPHPHLDTRATMKPAARHTAFILPITLLILIGTASSAAPPDHSYTIVVSKATGTDPQWKAVVDALVKKHRADIVVFDASVSESLQRLRSQFPRYVCFVATPAEATRRFVAEVHDLSRRLDDDPYTDVIWGILTGYDADCALRIARRTEPLTIDRVASGTDVELAVCREGVWYCELVKNRMVRKQPGEKPVLLKGPDDTTKALVDSLNTYRAQLFVTSGHATERGWQIGFRYRNGQFRCRDGQLFGLDTDGRRFDVNSPNPKVYLPVGNCLMGHIDGQQAMALAWLNSAGVCQMIGYTEPTWYGYAGWGCLDYFVQQPGRYNAAETFFVNQQALLHRLATYFPDLMTPDLMTTKTDARSITLSERARRDGLSAHDARGLMFDRNVLAFYGDPAWDARMAPGPLAWDQSLTEKDGVFEFEIRPKRGEQTFEPINTNGSQRGGRPIVQLLPHRIADVKIIEGADLQPLITDNFLLVPNPGKCDPKRPYRVVFRGKQI